MLWDHFCSRSTLQYLVVFFGESAKCAKLQKPRQISFIRLTMSKKNDEGNYYHFRDQNGCDKYGNLDKYTSIFQSQRQSSSAGRLSLAILEAILYFLKDCQITL